MIDVPVEVKDALREGTYKKNYRFVVTYDEWVDAGSFTTIRYSPSSYAGQGEKYIIKDNRKHRFVIDDANFNGYTFYYRNNNYGSWSTLSPIDRNTWELTGTGWNEIEISDYDGTVSYHSQVIVTKYIDTFTIDNDNLVSESVSIDERMCSGDTLKFGLCEGSSLEFQYFDKPNITGKRIQAFVDVDYGADEPYTIPMGFFDVKKCSRQASTGIIKATCYNKLQSEYLDAKANALIQEEFDFTPTVYVSDLIDTLLKEYSIKELKYEEQGTAPVGLWDTAISDATSNYKYRNLYGDQGPFGPAVLGRFHTITTNTNVYFKTYAHVARYTNLSDYPIKIDVPDYWDAIDEKIASFYQRQLQLIPASVNAETLWSRIKSAKSTSTSIPSKYMTNYMFNVTVVFTDQSKKTYGNNVTNSSGSFSDMKKLTFLNVSEVYILYPRCVLFTDDGGVGLASPGNTVYCTGADRPYLYQLGQGQDLLTNTYSTPKMDDGTDIPEWDIAKTLCSVYKITGGTSDADFIEVNIEDLPDVTLRELQSASFETICQFGQLSRTTDLFSGVELNHSRLYPADSLYPATDLYPGGAAASGFRSMYSKLWADEGNVHKWRYLIITYKGLDGEGNEQDYTLQRTVNNDGTDNYNCSDNWLFRNLVWTAEQIGEYADAMVAKMRDITWFPFEMWCAGLPYLETGDEIEIPLGEETYTSYILQRQLKGIQNLQDTYINGTLDIF